MDAASKYASSSNQARTRCSASIEDIAQKSRFENLVARFEKAPASQLDLTIAHWAVASDRRLPYALLDRTIRQLTTSSFESLRSTPGVGRNKFASLVMLLERALESGESSLAAATPSSLKRTAPPQDVFAPDLVSQVMWSEWQQTVRRHHLQEESLGRIAPSLQALPTVIWEKQLGEYLQYSIAELRSLKTHGDKRVNAVLEVFHLVHRALGHSPGSTRIATQLTPAFVPPIEQWLYRVLSCDEMPLPQDIRQHLVLPLLNQIEHDAGEIVHRLAAGRLGVEAFPEGVRDQSLELGVTRARIYQLLETCSDVMRIRWPAGRWMFKLLQQKLQSHPSECEALQMLESLQWLLYPNRRARAEPALA